MPKKALLLLATLIVGIVAGAVLTQYRQSFANRAAVDYTNVSLFSSQNPPSAGFQDNQAVELGVKFKSSVNGTISGIRFYKSGDNTGPHQGKLWTSGGQLLAQATFSNESTSGWQQVNFSNPVPITANTTYVASYFAPHGRYTVSRPFFTSDFVNGPLTAPRDTDGNRNGVYLYGANGGFPNHGDVSPNYWVDVVFSSLPNPTPTPTPTPTPHSTPTPQSNPTPTPTPTPRPTPTPTPRPTPTPTPRPTPRPTPTPTRRPSPTPTSQTSPRPTATTSPSPLAFRLPSPLPSTFPTELPENTATASAILTVNPFTNAKGQTKPKFTISGTADAQAKINISIPEEFISGSVTAGDDGKWSYTLDRNLTPGPKHLYISAINADGAVKSDFQSFTVVKSNWIWWLILILITGGIGFYVFKRFKKGGEDDELPPPTPEDAKPEPIEPTEIPLSELENLHHKEHVVYQPNK